MFGLLVALDIMGSYIFPTKTVKDIGELFYPIVSDHLNKGGNKNNVSFHKRKDENVWG